MSGQDKIMLGLTFFVGLAAGMYFYTVDFKPNYLPDRQDDIEEADAFSVIGQSYGGGLSDYTHPTFRIAEDGSYQYVPGGLASETASPVTGTLPRALMNELMDAVKGSDLERLSLSTQKEMCEIFVDGSDYMYDIRVNGELYQLDTCWSALPYEHALTQTLLDVWQYLETGTYEGSGTASEGERRNPAEEWLRRQFDWCEKADERQNAPTEPVACTMEAKICPDGSAVGRTGPNCEFAACPGE